MSDELYLLADVGGTNTRFALGNKRGVDPSSIRHFQNDRFENFHVAAAQYLQDRTTQTFVGGCIAVAGPVDGRKAKLTNRCWHFDAAKLETVLK